VMPQALIDNMLAVRPGRDSHPLNYVTLPSRDHKVTPVSPRHNPGIPNLSGSRCRHEANELAFWSAATRRRPGTTALERQRTDGNE
jgi:hypothetical protein